MTDAEQLTRICDLLRPVVDVDGLSVEDAVRKCRVVWLDEVRTLNDNLTQAIDSNMIAARERDAALAAVARERTYAGELEGCLQSIATAVTGSPDTSGIVVRVEKLVAERDAARAAVAEMRERAAKEADLRGGMTQGDDYDRGWVRCALRVAAAIRALPLPPSNEESKR